MAVANQNAPSTEPIEHSAARLRSMFPVDLRGLPGEPLVMQFEARSVGAVAVAWTTMSGVRTIRTEEHIRAHDPGVIVPYLVVSGSPVLAAGGHAVRLAPGDLTVISSSRPYELTPVGPHEALAFAIPRSLLGPDAQRFDEIALQRVADPITHRLVAPALARLGDAVRTGELGEADAAFGEVIVSMARALGAHRHGARSELEGAGARGALLLAQAKTYIEHHLHRVDLRPGEVADAQFISVRYLQKLFQAEGHTMLEWMRSARLRRARRDLGDPRQAHRTVAEIAHSWGFRHPGHFRRAFRAEFGVTPTQFRRDVLQQRPRFRARQGAGELGAA
jgi:AraC-like DNA-binding protein